MVPLSLTFRTQAILSQTAAATDILKTYLKTEHAPKAAIEALEDLAVDQHKVWKIDTGKIKKALGE